MYFIFVTFIFYYRIIKQKKYKLSKMKTLIAKNQNLSIDENIHAALK